MNEILSLDMINMLASIYHRCGIPDPSVILCGPLHCTLHNCQDCAGLCLSTRNTLLMQLIAGAQAEAKLKVKIQLGEVQAPRSRQD